MRFVFMPCFHCEEPWCVKACPTGAMQQREKDGIVFVESSLCVAARAAWPPAPGHTPVDPATHKVAKCDYCKDRLDAGLQPACVTKCVTGCLSFVVAKEVPDPRASATPVISSLSRWRHKGGAMSELQVLPAWLDADAAALAGAVPPAPLSRARCPASPRPGR